MQHTFGIFDSEADHLIEMVRQHVPLEQVRAAGCPVCRAAIVVTFAADGAGFTIACEGRPLHMTPYQPIAHPPPWWQECVAEPTDLSWYWRPLHAFDASGNLSMRRSGWRADGVRWSGEFSCPVDHPDYAFWRWVLLESGGTEDLIGDAELSKLRTRFARLAEAAAAEDTRCSD
jgi:hypothetical protein